MSKKIFHISHVDADGYGCNVVLQDLLKKNITIPDFETKDVASFNANYSYLEDIITMVIEEMEKEPLEVEKLLFITDLNIKSKEYIESILPRLEKCNAKIRLIDHHPTSKEISEEYDWYHVQNKDCATKEVVKILLDGKKPNKKYDDVIRFANTIDQYDLYKDPNSDMWLRGAILQDLSFKVSNVFSQQVELDEYLKLIKSDNPSQEAIELAKSKLIKAQQQSIKYNILMSKKIFEALENGIDTIKIVNGVFNKICQSIIETDFEDNEVKKEIMSYKFLTTTEKAVYLNKEQFGIDNRSYENIAKKIEFKRNKSPENDKLFMDEIKKMVERKLKILFPEELETIRNDFFNKNINYIEEMSIKNIDLMFSELDYKIKETIAEEIKKDPKLRKSEAVNKAMGKDQIPNFMLIAKTIGLKALDNAFVLKLVDEELDTRIKIATNLPISFYQHATHASYDTYEDNKGAVLINLNTNSGTMSARSCNGKAGDLMKKYGGGGHGNAGGNFIDLKENLPAELNEVRLNPKNYSPEVVKENQEKIKIFLLDFIKKQMNVELENKKVKTKQQTI